MKEPTRILCLGGGYVATRLVRSLRSSIKKGMVEVTIVDRNNYHTFHGLIAETLTGHIQPFNITSPARRLFAGATLHQAEIQSIDTANQTVTTRRALDGREYVLPYDHLVVSLGSVDDLSRYSGVAEHTFRLRAYWDCFRLRSHILTMLDLAEIEAEESERRRLLTFVVAGGNYAGVEVATELVDYFRVLTRKEYARIDHAEVRVILVHNGQHILPELRERFPGLVTYAERFVEQSGLELHLGTRVESATPEEVIFSNGERIATRTIISCTGTAQSPLLDQLDCERDDSGRLITDPYLRVPGHDNIWAGGDCAAVPHPRGGFCPPLATFAMNAGTQIGKNLRLLSLSQPPKPYRFDGLGDACSLGSRRAVGQLKDKIQFRGFVAWLIWRAFMLIYLPTWDRRVRTLLDWCVAPFLGRDIVAVRPDQTLGIEESLYEPGQTIVHQGEAGDSMYIIQQGEVEVLQHKNGVEEVIGTLSEGKHFGEMAVFHQRRRTASVRAKGRVRVLKIKQRAAEVLTGSVRALSTVREQPELESDSIPQKVVHTPRGQRHVEP